MRRVMFAVMSVAVTLMLAPSAAWAGQAHFVPSCSGIDLSRTGNTLAVSGKEAGLGDEAQVHIVVSATALCINGGGNHPKAVNKESLSSAGDFPVQNGKANFSLSLTATFQPPCDPPMTVEFEDVTVSDTTNGISCTFAGPF